jgi:hypothetical protein
MAKPVLGMIPPGGWHYYEGDVKLTGYSCEELYKVVRDFRAENHLPLGDVEGDVNSFICSRYPNFCHGVDMVVVTSVHPATRSDELLNDITIWAKKTLQSGKQIQLVSDELAEERAKICLSCPNNVNWRSGCGACIVAADRLSASIRQARDTKSSPAVGGCSKMRHDNRSAIFFERDNFTPTPGLPAQCWINI